MSMTDVITFVETQETRGCMWVHDDCFSYQPRRGWALVQRACFWFLSRIGCYHHTEYSSSRRVDVAPQASLGEIMRQQVSLAESLGQGGEILLIGADDWMEIMRQQPLWSHPMAFDAEYCVPRYERIRRTSWGSTLDVEPPPVRKTLRVCVVPWMRGVVLVPREALERRATPPRR